jgi:hypothetical protein
MAKVSAEVGIGITRLGNNRPVDVLETRHPPSDRGGNHGEWAKATCHHEQVSCNEWEWWVSWHDGSDDRRVLFCLLLSSETRCDLQRPKGSVCCLPIGHTGPHVPVSAAQAALPVIVDP